MKHIARFAFVFLCLTSPLLAQKTIHVDATRGIDRGNGSPEQPFKTMAQAAQAIPENHSGALTIIIQPGTYTLAEKVTFDKGRFTKKNRLTIRAALLPDDPNWTPAAMPVFLSSENPGVVEGRGKPIYGFFVDVSHVSFRGLRFKGNPAVGHRYYPIRRDKDTLDDLQVSQCMFLGDREKAPIHVAVIARGHGIVVENSIFISCRNPTVFWKAEGGNSYGNAFRYCIATDSYQSGLWTTDTASDFEFHNNVMVGGSVFHMHLFSRESFYSLRDSYIVGFDDYQRMTNGPGGKVAPNPAPLTIREHRIFRQGTILFDQNENNGTHRNWLHVLPGSDAADLNAGLFSKRSED